MKRRSPRTQRPKEEGITAIELVVALAVTGLMLALAVSMARTHLVRAQITESIGLATPVQHQVAQIFRASGIPPADGHALQHWNGGRTDGAYLESIEVIDGRIELKFGRAADAAIARRVLSLTPFESADGEIVWICGNDAPGVGLNPLGFAGGFRQAVQAPVTIEARYLPRACR